MPGTPAEVEARQREFEREERQKWLRRREESAKRNLPIGITSLQESAEPEEPISEEIEEPDLGDDLPNINDEV